MVVMRSKKMRAWLKTRQQFYSQLDDHENIVPLELQSEVREWLNNELGPPSLVLENNPYPIWTIKHTENYKLEKVRSFLATYSLTAYEGPNYWGLREYDNNWHIVITPRVPIAIVEKLNSKFGIVGQEEHKTPCLTWQINLKTKDLEELLIQIRKWFQKEPVVFHLSRYWEPDEEPDYSQFYNSIAVAPTSNKFDLIRFYDINGVNYDLDQEVIIKELILLDKKYGIDFIGPAEIQLQHIPQGQELDDLSNWLMNFCPESFNGGFDSEFDLSTGRIPLGWD